MVRTQVQLTEAQWKELKARAAREDVSVAALVRSAVNDALRARSGLDIESRRRRALDVVGRFSGGRPDVSQRHDAYLGVAWEEQ